ncbi:hypothetical protein ADUPG1_008623 [Aduncisulcus paluster]|uniref:Band 7 domain-containing protein n=1 Tax=Aduncisulcus paluster TaxID=2918883 RepID=A0ABQ5KSM2_9EUKA|nr:hypothetical protein ADUPG1_008623 [Aduncisulcus paluster]
MDSGAIGFIFASPLIVAAILALLYGIFNLLFGWAKIDVGEVALKRKGLSVKIEDEIYQPGIKLKGMFNKFIKFPTTQQSIEFLSNSDLIHARTKEGLELALKCSMYYSLQPENLREMYFINLDDYESLLIVYTVDIIRDVAAQYSADIFFSDFAPVAEKILEELTTQLNDKLFITVNTFNISDQDLPDRWEDSKDEYQDLTQEKANYDQKITLAESQQDASLSAAYAQEDVIATSADSDVVTISAEAEAEKSTIININSGYATSLVGYEESLEDNDSALQYLSYEALNSNDKANICFGTDSITMFT